jgi:hypothetical protein
MSLNQLEYEANEARMFICALAEVEKLQPSEKRACAVAWGVALRVNPEMVAERIGWLLDDNYGYGSWIEARKVAQNTRMNRVVWLAQVIAALEWQCPAGKAREIYKALPLDVRERIDELIQHEIDSHLTELVEDPVTA